MIKLVDWFAKGKEEEKREKERKGKKKREARKESYFLTITRERATRYNYFYDPQSRKTFLPIFLLCSTLTVRVNSISRRFRKVTCVR